MELSKQACMILTLAIAVYMDFKYYKVDNKLIIIGISIGSLHNLAQQSLYGLLCSIIWGMIPIGLLFFLYISSVLGAGDIKLFAVIGVFMRTSFCFRAIILAFVIGAVISLAKMVRYGIVVSRLQYFTDYVLEVIHTKKLTPYYNVEEKNREYVIHFSLPIGLSVVILCILSYV